MTIRHERARTIMTKFNKESVEQTGKFLSFPGLVVVTSLVKSSIEISIVHTINSREYCSTILLYAADRSLQEMTYKVREQVAHTVENNFEMEAAMWKASVYSDA